MRLKNLHLEVLSSFKLAAELNSFTEAAKILCISQSAVSKQIKSLEESLGVKLFERTHQGLRLTPQGMRLLQDIEAPMGEIESALSIIAHTQARRVIKVLAPITLIGRNLVPQLKEFSARFPDVSVEVASSLSSGADLERAGEGWDFILAYLKNPGEKTQFNCIRMERHIVVSSPSLWVNNWPPSLYASTLLHLVYDARNPSQAWAHWYEAMGASVDDITPKGVYFETLEQVIQAAISGLGIALVDEALVSQELQNKKLVKVSDRFMDGPYGYWLADLKANTNQSDLTHLLFRTLLERAAGGS